MCVFVVGCFFVCVWLCVVVVVFCVFFGGGLFLAVVGVGFVVVCLFVFGVFCLFVCLSLVFVCLCVVVFLGGGGDFWCRDINSIISETVLFPLYVLLEKIYIYLHAASQFFAC